jgi:hypothetical protein
MWYSSASINGTSELSMKCDVCGLEYGMAHNCPGPMTVAAHEILDAGLQAPADGGVAYYIGEVGKILQWDDEAIRRNAKDPRATTYGLIFWFVAMLIILLAPRIAGLNAHLPETSQLPVPFGVLAGVTLGASGMVALTLLQVGLCYLTAKWFLDGKGRFVEVLRPLMLVWFVNCLLLLPRGVFYAALIWTIVLMMVFEEVTGITRMQAFRICAAINFGVFAVQFEMSPVTHHL